MSIRETIRDWHRSGELFLLSPAIPSTPSIRWIFTSKEVFEAVHGPWSSEKEQKNMMRARATFDAFISGQKISVRLPPSKNVTAQLAQLEEANDEVWEFRCREPSPQVRVFGRFAEKDLFISFIKRNRDEFESNNDFLPVMEECKRHWRTFFPSYNPYRGSTADDYVSNCVSV
jgi:hypothetical protein